MGNIYIGRFRRNEKLTARALNNIVRNLPTHDNINPNGVYRDCGNGQVILAGHNIDRSVGVAVSQKQGLKPFALRWQKTGAGEDTGEWQIYLPGGCAAIDGLPYNYTNERGHDAGGNVIPDWYKIAEPQDGDAEIIQNEKYMYKQWRVTCRFRAKPVMTADTDADSTEPAMRTIVIGTLLEKTTTDAGGQTKTQRSTKQQYSTPFSATTDQTSWFKIIYELDGDSADPASYTAYLTYQYIEFGRQQVWKTAKTNISEMTDVVVKIEHSTSTPGISIVDELRPDTRDDTYIKILEMKDGEMTADLRSSIRKPLELYND